MSSISSARKGRPNCAKDSDYIAIEGDFRSAIEKWRKEQFDEGDTRPEDGPGTGTDTVTLTFGCVSDGSDEIAVELLPDGSIPPETRVRRGPTAVYSFTLQCGEAEIDSQNIWLNNISEEPIDICNSRVASYDALWEARNYRPPVPPPPPLKRLARQSGDSYLGFQIGQGDQPIKLSARWTAVAFNIPSAQVIGCISAAVEIAPLSEIALEIALFTAFGDCILHTKLKGSNCVRFDQQRIESGDCLLCFRGPLEGRGSNRHPHARILAVDPFTKAPLLDAVLWPPASDAPEPQTLSVAIPVFRFESQ